MTRARALACVALLACGSERNDTAGAQRHVASETCPLKTPAEWQVFLDAAASNETWVTTCSDQNDCQARVGAFTASVEDNLERVLAACAADVVNNPPIARCSERLRRFVPAWKAQHSPNGYGFVQDNASYFAAQTADSLPAGMMDPPPELIAALPERESLERAAREGGHPYLTHDSCLGGVRTYVLVRDPAQRFDQWVLFGLENQATVPIPSIVSFMAVQKQDAMGGVLERVRVHFRDYLVTDGDDGRELQLPDDYPGKCYACHTSGARELLSFPSSVTASAPVRGEPEFDTGVDAAAFGAARLEQLNDLLASYGTPDWNGTLEPADHGPPLGEGLGCTSCHDGVFRGALTVSTSEGMLYQKVVDQLAMRSSEPGATVPDETAMDLERRARTGVALSAEEQNALDEARAVHQRDYETLVASRHPALRAWLLAEACE